MRVCLRPFLLLVLLIFSAPAAAIDLRVHKNWVALEAATNGSSVYLGTRLNDTVAVEFSYTENDDNRFGYGSPDQMDYYTTGLLFRFSTGPFTYGAGFSRTISSGKESCRVFRTGDSFKSTLGIRHVRMNLYASAGLRWPIFQGFLGFNIASVHRPIYTESLRVDAPADPAGTTYSTDALDTQPVAMFMTLVAGYGF